MVLEESFPGKEDNPTHGGFPLGGWVLGVSVLKRGGLFYGDSSYYGIE